MSDGGMLGADMILAEELATCEGRAGCGIVIPMLVRNDKVRKMGTRGSPIKTRKADVRPDEARLTTDRRRLVTTKITGND